MSKFLFYITFAILFLTQSFYHTNSLIQFPSPISPPLPSSQDNQKQLAQLLLLDNHHPIIYQLLQQLQLLDNYNQQQLISQLLLQQQQQQQQQQQLLLLHENHHHHHQRISPLLLLERLTQQLRLLHENHHPKSHSYEKNSLLPLVINTWPFTDATNKAYDTLTNQGTALDSIEMGCNQCEIDQCDGTVGYGGSPDSTGETTLDAMIMDGRNRQVGAVGYLQGVKDAIKVARSVMDHSTHSFLVGQGATQFAKMMGFPIESLTTSHSKKIYNDWRIHQKCQPNFYINVYNKTTSCPPYKPIPLNKNNTISMHSANPDINSHNHDTIGMVAISSNGDIAGGTSSNGANHKIAGRVGDAPIPGAGVYVVNTIGGAAATGDGDVMMRFLPTFQAVAYMKEGFEPKRACEEALLPIIQSYPNFKGGIVCANKKGEYGGAAYGWNFSYSIRSPSFDRVQVIQVTPLKRISQEVSES